MGIPTLPNTTEVLCTMPQMQTHKQLPHTLMACTRYHRPNRERTKQKQEMVKLTETKTVLLKDLVEQARKEYGWPNLRSSPKKDEIRKIPDTYWKEQHDQGKQLKEVAEELNISPCYLSKYLTSQGIYWRQL